MRHATVAIALVLLVGCAGPPATSDTAASHVPLAIASPGPYTELATWPDVPITPPLHCAGGDECQLTINVHAPTADGPWPIALLVPGGPQPLADQPDLLDSTLADTLASHGVVVMTTEWRQGPSYGGNGFPDDIADLACAVGVARATGDRYGGDPSNVTLVGHSLGGWAGAVLWLTPSGYEPSAQSCLPTSGSLRPDRFVAIDGALNGATQTTGADFTIPDEMAIAPEEVQAADPFALLQQHRPAASDPPITLIQGSESLEVLPQVARDFEAAAKDAGYRVQLTEVPGAEHHTVLEAAQTLEALMEALAAPSH